MSFPESDTKEFIIEDGKVSPTVHSRPQLISKMEPRLAHYRFSSPFNHLTFLGMWRTEVPRPIPKLIFQGYRFTCTAFLLSTLLIQAIDLYFAVGNLRKITFNFCTSIISFGVLIKILLFHRKKDLLYELRMGLWMDSLTNNSPEDVEIYDAAYKKLNTLQKLFYASLATFLPIWIVCSYFSYLWGPRQLAFAGYFPMEDPMEDRFFLPPLAQEAVAALYIIVVVIEAELAMFSIMLQLEACYQILSKNFLKLNEIYGDEEIVKWKEVNVNLKRENARQLLRSLIIHHLQILKFMKHFEEIYSPCMFLQVTGGSVLLVMNGVELTMTDGFAAKLFFQSGYTVLILMDIFFVSFLLTRLTTEGSNIGTSAYSTAWYNMDPELKKSIRFVISRCQIPPRITVGKFFTADLNTYLSMLGHTYSWLMLFRQLGGK